MNLQLDDLSTHRSTALPATDGAVAPFWSADGTRVGFFANGRIRTIELASGSIADLVDAPNGRGATMNAAGDLVFAPNADGVLSIRAASGAVRPLTTLGKGETSHRWPAFLADGTHVVFLARAADASRSAIWITSIDSPTPPTRLVASEGQAIVAGMRLLFATSEALVAQSFDPKTWSLSGSAGVVGLPVGRGPLDQLFATASPEVLIFGEPGTSLRELRWVERDGTPPDRCPGSDPESHVRLPIRGQTPDCRAGEPAEAWSLRLSPDGERIAVTELDPQTRSLDVWLQDQSRPVPQRLSLSIDADTGGAWSPNGNRIGWIAARRRVTTRGAGAVLPEVTLATFDAPVEMWDWSRDDGFLVIGRTFPDSQDDLWLLPQAKGVPPRPYATLPFNQVDAAVSPDSRWVAYASDESGKFDIYIDTFPTPSARVRVTTAGGVEPRWRRDGRELYFRRGSEIHAVGVSAGAATSTTRLFDAVTSLRAYDASADGQHFLLNVPAASAAPAPMTIVMNWQSRISAR